MEKIKVAIVFRSTADSSTASHAGLGICAVNTAKTLNQHGIKAVVWPTLKVDDISRNIELDPEVTHILIQAPWISSQDLHRLALKFPHIQFAVNCHSNVGFLQADGNAMTKMLQLLDLEQLTSNLHAAGNSVQFVRWMEDAYQSVCTHIPNLYYLDERSTHHRPLWNGGVLKIGIFGAPRSQKNVVTGAAGAIQIAQTLKTPTEIWVNAGRDERDGKRIRETLKCMIAPNPFCTYREFGWASWPEFRRFIGSMNLLVQMSYTESFNQVTADGISMGVPSVVGSAIRWVPDYWKADCDSAESVCLVGQNLLRHHHAARDGLRALEDHNALGIGAWKRYLLGSRFRKACV